MIFDTHAHYDDEKFDADRDTVLSGLKSSGVSAVINPGCDVLSSIAALKLAEKYDFIYAAVGIHPEEIPENTETDLAELTALCRHDKCVAIGEIGLDYYWDSSRRDDQIYIFRRQLELALRLDFPVIVHDREAHGDCLEIVKQYPALRGVFHCFSGSREMAEELLSMGWYLGFDGPVTYKNARKCIEVLESCPLDRILLETDSPYMPPVPLRGTRNTSSNLSYVAEKIAEIKGLSYEELCGQTFANAKRLFEIN